MRLKSQVEWALHCCILLAGLPAGRYLATKTLAEFHGVPKEYLSKALQAVSQAGLVESTLGPSGGYRLARASEAITFLDVVEAVEGKGPSFLCTEIRKNNPCRPAGYCDDKPCGIARVMWEADRAWRETLAGVRLSDLLGTLESSLPAQQRADTAAWIAARS